MRKGGSATIRRYSLDFIILWVCLSLNKTPNSTLGLAYEVNVEIPTIFPMPRWKDKLFPPFDIY